MASRFSDAVQAILNVAGKTTNGVLNSNRRTKTESQQLQEQTSQEHANNAKVFSALNPELPQTTQIKSESQDIVQQPQTSDDVQNKKSTNDTGVFSALNPELSTSNTTNNGFTLFNKDNNNSNIENGDFLGPILKGQDNNNSNIENGDFLGPILKSKNNNNSNIENGDFLGPILKSKNNNNSNIENGDFLGPILKGNNTEYKTNNDLLGPVYQDPDILGPMQDIDDRVKSRFIATDAGFYDKYTKKYITSEEKDVIEGSMRNVEGDRIRALEDKIENNGVANAINNVEDTAGNLPGSDSTTSRSFNDVAIDYLGDRELAEFLMNASEDEMRDFVTNENLKDFYKGLYNADGTFNDEGFSTWYWDNENNTIDDILGVDQSTGMLTNAGDFFGGDYGAFDNIVGYLIDNGMIGQYQNEYNPTDSEDDGGFYTTDRESIIKALAYDYAMSQADKVYNGEMNPYDLVSMFSNGENLNNFMNNDAFEFGLINDGYQSAEDLGRTNINRNIMYTPAWAGRTPVSGGVDYMLGALPKEWGARYKEDEEQWDTE